MTIVVKLVEHIIKADEIRKYKQRLKEKELLEKLEQKMLEKEKLKQEMGSDYQSYQSSEDSFLKEFETEENTNEDDLLIKDNNEKVCLTSIHHLHI